MSGYKELAELGYLDEVYTPSYTQAEVFRVEDHGGICVTDLQDGHEYGLMAGLWQPQRPVFVGMKIWADEHDMFHLINCDRCDQLRDDIDREEGLI